MGVRLTRVNAAIRRLHASESTHILLQWKGKKKNLAFFIASIFSIVVTAIISSMREKNNNSRGE